MTVQLEKQVAALEGRTEKLLEGRTEKLRWDQLVPVYRRNKFLTGEHEYCRQEEEAFDAAPEDNKPRAALLQKREEYLQQYLDKNVPAI